MSLVGKIIAWWYQLIDINRWWYSPSLTNDLYKVFIFLLRCQDQSKTWQDSLLFIIETAQELFLVEDLSRVWEMHAAEHQQLKITTQGKNVIEHGEKSCVTKWHGLLVKEKTKSYDNYSQSLLAIWGEKKPRINLLMPLLPYRFFFLPYRFAGYLHLSQSKRFMHMRAAEHNWGCGFPLWGEPPWQGDQWAMVFEDGFRVNFVIVFVIVLLSFCVT